MNKLYHKIKESKTIVNGALFSLYSFFNQGISFILLILLANYISPGEYGQLSIFNTIVTFLTYFIALSTEGYLSVSYFKRNTEGFKEDFSSISYISIVMTLILLIIIIFSGDFIANFADLPQRFLFYSIVISFFNLFFNMYLNYQRIQEKVKRYGIASCSFALISFILTLYLVINKDLNWEGRVYSNVICTIMFGAISLFYFIKERFFVIDISKKELKTIVLWGIPLIPHLASIWIRQGGDRFIINSTHAISDVGLFSFALNLTSIIIMIGSAFNSTNSVSIYKILSSGTDKKLKLLKLKTLTRTTLFIYIIAYILIIIGVTIFVPILLPHYKDSIPYFLILSVQGLGQCGYFLYCNYLFYYHKNKQIMYITFFTSLLHLILSLIFTKYSLYYTCLIYAIIQIIVVIIIKYKAQNILKYSLK